MDNYINRDKFLEEYSDVIDACNKYFGKTIVNKVIDKIKEFPTEDVTPVKHGRWLDGKCTNCTWEMPDRVCFDGYEDDAWHRTPYCPECGAKMDLED